MVATCRKRDPAGGRGNRVRSPRNGVRLGVRGLPEAVLPEGAVDGAPSEGEQPDVNAALPAGAARDVNKVFARERRTAEGASRYNRTATGDRCSGRRRVAGYDEDFIFVDDVNYPIKGRTGTTVEGSDCAACAG